MINTMIPEFDFKKATQDKLSTDVITRAMVPVIVLSIVGYVFFTESYRSVNPLPLIISAILVILEQLILALPGTKKYKAFQSGGPVPIVLYNLSLFVTVVLYLPLYSPFLLVVAVIMFISVYFRGLIMLSVSIGFWALTVFVYTLHNGYPHLPAPKLLPYLAVILGAIFAIVVQRAGVIDNHIRSDLIKASDKVLESSEELNSLINGINDSVIATNLEGKVKFYNSVSLHMLKIPAITVNDDFSKYIRLFNEDDKPIDLIGLVKENKGIKGYNGLHLFDANNEKINVSIDISLVTVKQSEPPVNELIFLIRDVSKDKTLDQEQDEFAAVTSLELKTPIAAAETNLSLVMNKDFMTSADEQTIKRLKRAHDSLLYLNDLIKELTQLTNIQGPDHNTKYEEVDPVEFIRQLYLTVGNEATEKGLKLNTKVVGELHAIYTSRIYLTEILQNFLTNAIKYAQGGEITLTAEKSTKFENGVLFSVTDTGPEIAKVEQPIKADEESKPMDVRGIGLGLYLALKLARYINAKVWFDNTSDSGTTLYLEVRPVEH